MVDIKNGYIDQVRIDDNGAGGYIKNIDQVRIDILQCGNAVRSQVLLNILPRHTKVL